MPRKLLATSVVLLSIFLGITLWSIYRGPEGPSDEAVAALAQDLESAFPSQIEFIDWENAPPMDPPAILIDFERDLPDAELLALLCDEIKPRVIAVHSRIDVFADGWTISENCP